MHKAVATTGSVSKAKQSKANSMIDREAAVVKTTEILAATLTRISGLPVRGSRNGKGRYFMFGPKDRTIKTVYTYRKAKVFAEGVAEGVAIGRKRESMKLLDIALTLAGGIAVATLVICAPELGTAVALGALTIMVAINGCQK